MNLFDLIKKYKFIIIGTAIGAIIGFLYWQNIGCENGTCMIKSSPYLSTIYGAIFGALSTNIIENLFNKNTDSGKT